jgi:hypothetical protein
VAVQVPGAGVSVDDGLEGAEAAFGGGGGAGEVDEEGLGLFAGHGLAAGEDDAGFGRAGTGDPDGVEGVFELRVGVGEVDVVLGHAFGDVAEVALDVGEVRTVAQQVRRQGVAGLVWDAVADVQGVHPVAESLVEPAVAGAFTHVAGWCGGAGTARS